MNRFMPFDRVAYTGEKLRGSVKNGTGEVIYKVQGEENAYVVEFEDTFSYIVSGDNLRKLAPSKPKDEVEVNRRRKTPEDEEV